MKFLVPSFLASRRRVRLPFAARPVTHSEGIPEQQSEDNCQAADYDSRYSVDHLLARHVEIEAERQGERQQRPPREPVYELDY